MDQPNTPPTTPLSETERFEYQQLSDWARHDDTMIYQTASTVLPLSFGAVAVAVQYPKMAIPLAVFSLALYGYWLVVAMRLSWFSSVRIDRMRGLETMSAMRHHTQLKEPPEHLRSKVGSGISIRKYRTIGAVTLGIAWLVTLYVQVNAGKDEKPDSSAVAAVVVPAPAPVPAPNTAPISTEKKQ